MVVSRTKRGRDSSLSAEPSVSSLRFSHLAERPNEAPGELSRSTETKMLILGPGGVKKKKNSAGDSSASQP